MQQSQTFSSISHKIEQKPNVNNPKKDSLIKKIITSGLGILLAVVISGSIPFVKKYYETAAAKLPVEVTQPSIPKTLPQNMKAFIWAARLKIEDLKLHHRLSIDANENSHIAIKGDISIEEKLRWQEFLNWYDKKTSFPRLTHEVTASAISGNIPELKSVWFNEVPIAYFKDGSFGSAGSIIQDGWEIVTIEAWAVLVERDGAMITLSYQ